MCQRTRYPRPAFYTRLSIGASVCKGNQGEGPSHISTDFFENTPFVSGWKITREGLLSQKKTFFKQKHRKLLKTDPTPNRNDQRVFSRKSIDEDQVTSLSKHSLIAWIAVPRHVQSRTPVDRAHWPAVQPYGYSFVFGPTFCSCM